MASKRMYSEDTLVHPSRQHQVPLAHPRPTKKPRAFDHGPKKQQANTPGVNTLKKNIRSVTRHLERFDDLPADVRVEEERRLAGYQSDLTTAEQIKYKQKMIKRYHMVRFFERQKATRHLKKQRKQLLAAQTPEDIEAAKARVHVAEVDLNYALFSPLSQPYISLYPAQPAGADVKEEEPVDHYDVSKKPLVWSEVEQSMVDGTLEFLRNRLPMKFPMRPKPKKTTSKSSSKPKVTESAPKQSSGVHVANGQPSKPSSTNRVKKERIKKEPTLDKPDDESDGGFFEE